jgi:hypothetical protein
MFHQSHWMSVLKTNDEAEAEIIAGALETSGIMTRLHHERAGSALTTITVLVDERDYERALAVGQQPAAEPA